MADERCSDTALFFDRNIPAVEGLNFEDSDKWLPKASDFELINYYIMSNGCGERWALVTVKNITSGVSSLSNEDIVALMADGSKRVADIERRIEGYTTESFLVGFGYSKIPIIKVLVKTKE